MQISFTKRKIQYLYLGLIIVSLLLGLVSYARAQESALAPEQLPAAANAAKNTPKSLSQEQQNRFINLVRNVYIRMEAAATRLENISSRIDERIVQMNAEGFDTSEATVPFEQAKARLSAIKAQLAEAKVNAESGLISDNPRERFKTARTQFHAVSEALRETFLLLRETVNALKDAVTATELNQAAAAAALNETVTSEDSTN